MSVGAPDWTHVRLRSVVPLPNLHPVTEVQFRSPQQLQLQTEGKGQGTMGFKS